MRIISDLEKQIIDRICEGQTHISTIFTDHIPDLLLKINKDNDTAELLILKNTDQKKSIEIAIKQTEKIIYIIKFLMYLEHEGYILSGYFSHGRVVDPIMGLKSVKEKYDEDTNNYLNWPFTDIRIQKIIYAYCDLTILPIHQLIEFKKQGYRTQEDIRHNDMLVVSGIALFISLALGIYGVYQNINANNPTKKQVDSLINKLEMKNSNLPTKQQLDTLILKLNFRKVTNDDKSIK